MIQELRFLRTPISFGDIFVGENSAYTKTLQYRNEGSDEWEDVKIVNEQ